MRTRVSDGRDTGRSPPADRGPRRPDPQGARRPAQHPLLRRRPRRSRPGRSRRCSRRPASPRARATSTPPRRSSSARTTCEVWDELEECVSGFNVQIINQASHLILWLTNLNAWYGRAVDGISSVALSGAMSKYHGWNYEFSMTQTIPRLMSFPTERTEILLRFESGQAAANAIAAGVGLGRRQHPDRVRPQARRHREGVRPAAALPLHLGPRGRLPARERRRRRPAPAPEVREALPRQRLRRPATHRIRRRSSC